MGKKPFEALVDEHGAVVLRVCRSLLGSQDADDAWSETFLAALRSYPDMPAEFSVQAWLVTIAKRKALDIVRSSARRDVPLAVVPDHPDANSIHPADVGYDLSVLTERQRLAVTRHYLDGMAYEEIAQLTGGTAAAARRAAADGIKALRLQLQGNDYD